MKHQIFGKKLNRDRKERKALFKSLIIALIKNGKIKTTLAKGRAIYGLADKLVTHAKSGSRSSRAKIQSFLARGEAVDKLIKEIAPRFSDRISGYIRMRKLGKRWGDQSEEVVLEWSSGSKIIEKAEKIKQKEEKGKQIKEKAVRKK